MKELQQVSSLCNLIQNLVSLQKARDPIKVFAFACIWAIGGSLSDNGETQNKTLFSQFIKDMFQSDIDFEG